MLRPFALKRCSVDHFGHAEALGRGCGGVKARDRRETGGRQFLTHFCPRAGPPCAAPDVEDDAHGIEKAMRLCRQGEIQFPDGRGLLKHSQSHKASGQVEQLVRMVQGDCAESQQLRLGRWRRAGAG